MDEDIKLAIEHVCIILKESFAQRNEKDIDLERKIKNFWNKMKKKMPEDVAKNFSLNPENETYEKAFSDELAELMTAQNVKMNVVIFLYNQGVKLFD